MRAFETLFVHSLKSLSACGQIDGRIFIAGITLYQIVKTYDASLARIGHHLDLLLITRLEAHGCRGGNIEMATEGLLALKV